MDWPHQQQYKLKFGITYLIKALKTKLQFDLFYYFIIFIIYFNIILLIIIYFIIILFTFLS